MKLFNLLSITPVISISFLLYWKLFSNLLSEKGWTYKYLQISSAHIIYPILNDGPDLMVTPNNKCTIIKTTFSLHFATIKVAKLRELIA